jgi:hypothetical protein
MTTTEELSHKKVQAIYLRKLLELLTEEITNLENILCYVEGKPVYAGSELWNSEGFKYTVEGVETHKSGKTAFVSATKNNQDGHWTEAYTWDQLKPIDPYAELKAAHAAGKRIAFFDDRYKEFFIADDPIFCHAAKKYKIVEDDEEVIMHVLTGFGDVMTKYTRSALTGKIAAEVVG